MKFSPYIFTYIAKEYLKGMQSNMEEKIRDYILKLEIVLNKCLNELDDLDINMGEKTTLPYNKLCMINKIESKLQTVLEIKNDLQNILKEEQKKNMNENNWIGCNEKLPKPYRV